MQPHPHAIAVFLGASLALSAAHSAVAHHSTAEFDYTRQLVIEGVIKEVQWTNPHSFVQVMVETDGAALEQWSVEIGSPSINSRRGWRKDSVKSGDRAALLISPARNGKPYGTLRVLTLEDGQEFEGAAVNIGSNNAGRPPAAP